MLGVLSPRVRLHPASGLAFVRMSNARSTRLPRTKYVNLIQALVAFMVYPWANSGEVNR